MVAGQAVTAGLSFRYQQLLLRVLAAIGSGTRPSGSSEKATVIAVSKKQTVDAIESLYHLGHRDFGENYVQELVEKAEEMKKRDCPDVRWHFIGHLQTNKVRLLMPYVYAVHAVDSAKLAHEVGRRWLESGRKGKLPVFIEVNIDREKNKAGVYPDDALELAEAVAKIKELSLEGLMCIPAPSEDLTAVQSAFRRLRDLELRCRPRTKGRLSMGMSNDFELALQEGATHIRVGTALFGSRPV